MIREAADRLGNSMENTRDQFEQMTHETDLFLKQLGKKDSITASYEEGFKGAADLAAKAESAIAKIADLEQKQSSTDPNSIEFKKRQAEIEALKDNVQQYGTAASGKLQKGQQFGASGFDFAEKFGGSIEKTIAEGKSIQAATGMSDADTQKMTRDMLRTQLNDQLRSFSGEVEKAPGESEEDAEIRFGEALDNIISQIAPEYRGVAMNAGAGAVDKTMQGNYDTSVTSSENLWSSIQNSLSGVDNEKASLEEQKKIAEGIKDTNSSLGSFRKDPLTVRLAIE